MDKEEKMRLALGDGPSCQAGAAGRQLWHSTVSSREHHVPVTFCHWQVQCQCPSSGLMHLSATLVQEYVLSYPCDIPWSKVTSPWYWNTQLCWIVLTSLIQWILNNNLNSAGTEPCIPACMFICFPITLSWNKSWALPRVWKAPDQRKQANLTWISRFQSEYSDSWATVVAAQSHLPRCEEQVTAQGTSAAENVRIPCVSSQPPPHKAPLSCASSGRFSLSPDPLLRVWACPGCETFSVEAPKSL